MIDKISFRADNSNYFLNSKFLNKNTGNSQVATPPSQNSQAQPVASTALPVKSDKLNKQQVANIVTASLALTALGVTTASSIRRGKIIKANEAKIQELTQKIDELVEKASRAAQTSTAGEAKKVASGLKSTLLAAIAAFTGGLTVEAANKIESKRQDMKDIGLTDDEVNEIKSEVEKASKYNEGIRSNAANAVEISNRALTMAPHATTVDAINMGPYMRTHSSGLKFLDVHDYGKKIDNVRNDVVLKRVATEAPLRFERTADMAMKEAEIYRTIWGPKLGSNAVWSVTAEFDPIKLGGLGSVPVELQNNFARYGVEMPTFIPMYLPKGNSHLRINKDKGNTTYEYKFGNKKYDVTKIASFPMHIYKGDTRKTVDAEFYMHTFKDDNQNEKQLVFVNIKNAFDGNLYDNLIEADEPEKFAILDKAVYQLAKEKISSALGSSSLTTFTVEDMEAYESLKAPVGFVLNDWHAASLSGMMRYRSGYEYAYKEINADTYEALSKMPTVMIGHNTGIVGSTRGVPGDEARIDMATQNIINDMFDEYANVAVEKAETRRTIGPNESGDLGNAILFKPGKHDKEFNSSAHGIALSDFYTPVSRTYAWEVANGIQNSGMALNFLEARAHGKRDENGKLILEGSTVEGNPNGSDRSANDLKAHEEKLWNNFGINVEIYSSNDLIKADETGNAEEINAVIDSVIKKRMFNKKQFYDNYLKAYVANPRGFADEKKFETMGNPIELPDEKEFMNAPFLAFGHRLSEQKGLPIFQKAVTRLFNDWDKIPELQGKTKPFVFVGGQDNDGSGIFYLNEMKNPNVNAELAKRTMSIKGYTPNPALMASATLFCAPSTYEPCGLTQGEAFSMGTPVLMTRTGGFVETIKDRHNGYLADYSSAYSENIDRSANKGADYEAWICRQADKYYEKLVEAMKDYYSEGFEAGVDVNLATKNGANVTFSAPKMSNTYRNMVANALRTNLDWDRNDENDPIHTYFNKFGIPYTIDDNDKNSSRMERKINDAWYKIMTDKDIEVKESKIRQIDAALLDFMLSQVNESIEYIGTKEEMKDANGNVVKDKAGNKLYKGTGLQGSYCDMVNAVSKKIDAIVELRGLEDAKKSHEYGELCRYRYNLEFTNDSSVAKQLKELNAQKALLESAVA